VSVAHQQLYDPYRAAYLAATSTARPQGRASRFVRPLVVALVAFACAIAAAVTVPSLFGHQSFVVLSGSMEPVISTGDIVVVEQIKPAEARIGDVVSFRSPDVPGKIITHRVVDVRAVGEELRFVTKGDANNAAERWTIARSGTIGRAGYQVPKLGYVTNRIGSAYGRIAFIVIPALLLAAFELRRIWSREPDAKTAGPDGR
jgi:signal peptidase I